MRIIFLGTPEFAAYSLQTLHKAGKNIVAVITAPDKKAGRGQQIKVSAVKEYALANHIDCLQPTNLKDPEFLKQLMSYNADLQIVVAFRMLPEVVWSMPKFGTMNLHASLLPYYRGAAPINWAIINGEKKSGVSTFFLKHEIDTGEILLQKEIALTKNETASSLHDKLMKNGATLLVESVELVEEGTYKGVSQEDLLPAGVEMEELPKAPKIFRNDCRIDWTKTSNDLDLFIRGLSPYPTAWTSIKKKNGNKSLNLKIYSVDKTDLKAQENPAKVYSEDDRIFVVTGDGVLEINELQLEGKKKMKAKDFLNGTNLDDYESILS